MTRYQCILHPGKWHAAPCLCEPRSVRRIVRWAGFLTATAMMFAVVVAAPSLTVLAVIVWFATMISVMPDTGGRR